ncbi:hypothetical protein O181_033862 [Austropuccinia psidii MF-1]|uniref:Uncharacterized protein n=1 Tax=Austropuccinia psidii MF-1 TaxID=1389203 RepID=A0A9Q3D5G6_9BASI|nr:hypothetical protein [Austropuccinia psidii MF-1]
MCPIARSLKIILDRVGHHSNRFMQESFKNSKERWDKIHKPPVFELGDLVLVSTVKLNNIERPKKLKNSFTGPSMIRALHGPNAVQLELTGQLMKRTPSFLCQSDKILQLK